MINESLWTGLVTDCDGLVSLKEILEHNYMNREVRDAVEYIMLSSIIRDNNSDTPFDLEKDFHLVVRRTSIEFNQKQCCLVTFTDISVQDRLKHVQEKSNKEKALKTFIQDVIVNPLNPTLAVL